MSNVTRTLDSSHGGTRQSGEAGQRRLTFVTTPPSAREVGSRRKEASEAPSRNSSRRSKKNITRCLFMTSSWLCWLKDRKWIKVVTTTPTLTWETQNHLFFVLHRGSDEKKEKGGDKTPEHQNSGEHETSGKTPKLAHVELNRGTAVWTQH